MNPLRATLNALGFKKKVFDPMANIDLSKIGWHKLDGTQTNSTMDFYHSKSYDSSYASIKAIANAFLMIEPYAVNAKGTPVPHNVLDRIYTPNTEMSAPDFREALAVMTAVHAKVYVRVHHTGESATPTNITGFTFLENVVEMVVAGQRRYQLADGTWLYDDEVMTLKNINPYNLGAGYSPADAARRWTSLDDYIATYQAGFFRNGAIPAGQFIITAPSTADFNDIVDSLQQNHRGAGRNNNATYVHRPTDAMGKAQNAQIEWVPFNQENKDLGLGVLFEQANKKIDSAYGVPASIRGVNDSNTYASVRVDEVIFAKYVVNPIAMKIWGKFTHELNRITGGLGVAFTYDFDEPQVADEELVKAQATQVRMATVQGLLAYGYSLDTIVEALELPEELLALDGADTGKDDKEDETDVRENGEADDAPDAGEKRVKKIDPNTRNDYEERVSGVVRQYTKLIIDDAVATLENATKGASKVITDEEVAKFVRSLSTVLVPLIYLEGGKQTSAGINLLLESGIVPTSNLTFKLTQEQLTEYRLLLKKIGNSYTDTVKVAIRQVLDRSAEQQLSANQIKQQLYGILDEKWRIDRIARTEVGRGATKGSVYAMENIQKETGYKIAKVWAHTNPSDTGCEYCSAMIGTTIDVREVFLKEGEQMAGVNGGILTNDFTDVEGGQLHPNCHCYTTYKVIT